MQKRSRQHSSTSNTLHLHQSAPQATLALTPATKVCCRACSPASGLAAVQAETATTHLQESSLEAVLVDPKLVSVEVGSDHVEHCPALLVADAVKEVLDDPC